MLESINTWGSRDKASVGKNLLYVLSPLESREYLPLPWVWAVFSDFFQRTEYGEGTESLSSGESWQTTL